MSRYYWQSFLRVPDGANVFFEVTGEGAPPAVLCDGLGCDGFIWRYLRPQLAQKRAVLHWHYRGHGQSTPPDDKRRVGMGFLCDDLAKVMDEAKMPEAILFGHSMGTQVALEFHRRYPERVRGLVLLCGAAGNLLDTWHDHTLLRKAFPYLSRLVERYPEQAKRITSRLMNTEVAAQFSIRTELNRALLKREDFAPYLEHLAVMEPLMFTRTLESVADHSALDHLPEIECPTLVVGGEIDRFTPVWLSHRMAELIPGAEYALIAGGSHTAPLERPDQVGELVEQFIAKRAEPFRQKKRAAQAH